MSSIDERIVNMQFNNAQFEAGVKNTNKSLGDLKKSLQLDGASKGLNDVQSAAGRLNLSHIADGVQNISGKFTALGAVAFGALASIGAKAVAVGAQLVSSLTIAPISQGFEEYQTNMESIQTILSNTRASGAGLKDVNAALDELNLYSDKTIYNFSEMARNIGTFTAAGVGLKPATAAIKGIANLAALSGSNSQQASTAMYQLSQAISSGRVGLQDWNSVVNAGMGGAVFQRALARTAVTMGALKDSSVKLSGPMKNVSIEGKSFRESIMAKPGQVSWLTSDVLTKTLAQFTGDMTDAQLASEGFNAAQIKQIQDQAKSAQQAATQVKTASALIGTLQESAGSGWSSTFRLILGDYNQSTQLFTALNNVFGKIISDQANARNNLLKGFNKLGGRTVAIDAISNAFKFLMAVIKPIGAAFRQIFPPATGAQLFAIVKAVDNFTKTLTVSGSTANKIQRTFAGVFAVLDIGRMIIVGVITTIAGLFGQVAGGTGGFLTLTSAIGDFLVNLRNAIRDGNGLKVFFQGLGAVLQVPIALIGALVGALADLVSGGQNVSRGGLGKAFSDIGKRVQPLSAALGFLQAVFAKFAASASRIFAFISPLVSALGDMFGELGKRIADSLENTDYSTVLDTINTVLFGGLLALIAKFVKNGINLSGSLNIGGGLFGGIKEALEGVTGTLTAMQQNLKANVLLKIAAALGILTASVVALSLVDSGKLTVATGALAAMFTQLGIAMALFSKISLGPGILKMEQLTASMILLAIAINVLASAVVKLSGLDLAGLAKGLGGVVVLMGGLVASAKLLSGAGKGLVTAGLGMIAIAVAINILASAVAKLGGLNTGELIQGLIGVGVALATIAGFTKLLGNPAGLISSGVGLVLLGAALNVVAAAVQKFSAIKPEAMANGLIAMGGALAIVAGAVALLPGPSLILTGAGLVIVAAALNLLASALASMGGLSMDEIGKSLGVLAASLIILAASLYLMTASLPGAAALLVAAAALVVLVPALQAMGSMDIDSIGKALGLLAASLAIMALSLTLMVAALPGAAALLVAAAALTILTPVLQALGAMDITSIGIALLALAGTFAVLGVAGALLTPLVPTLLGLGVAIALIGVGIGAAGAGVFLLAAGLTALGAAGAVGAVGITVVFSAVLGLIPLALQKLGEGIVALAGVIQKGAPAIVNALVAVLMSLLNAVVKLAPALFNAATVLILSILRAVNKVAPQIASTFQRLLTLVLGILVRSVPQMVSAGLKIITGVYQGIANNIGKIVTAATNIIVKFIGAIGSNLPRIVAAGIKLIVSFVNGVANGVRSGSAQLNAAGRNLASALIEGMVNGIAGGIGAVIGAAQRVANAALNAAKAALGIHSPSKEFEKIGVYVNEGFAKGLIGSKDSVAAAYDTMKQMLTDAAKSAEDTISSTQEKLDGLKANTGTNAKAIAIARKELALAQQAEKKAKGVKGGKTKTVTTGKGKNKKTKTVTTGKGKNKKTKTVPVGPSQSDAKTSKDKAHLATLKKQEALNKLLAKQSDNSKDIDDATQAIADATSERDRANAATAELTNNMADEEAQLESLGDAYSDLTDRIDESQKALDDAIKTRDDYNKSIRDQYNNLSDINENTQLTTFTQTLQDQIEKTTIFTQQLQQLRKEGLNDALYTKLLGSGTDAIPFVTQLLDSGQSGVDDLNSLSGQLDAAAAKLGNNASTALYQAAVDSAAGLVEGLKNQQDAIAEQMNSIADIMVNSIKSKLGIQSPSKEFAKIGKYSGQGLTTGLEKTRDTVAKAASNVGDTAISSLKKSMSNMSYMVANEMDTAPTIRPVLDLSAIRQGASGITDAMGRPVLSTSTAYSSAATANDGYQSNREQMLDAKSEVSTVTNNNFVQNNTSPKALSTGEIYRRTNNQISQIRKKGPSSNADGT